jgi:nitrate reductase assembly molybdenum cofactor insertion protein NarJ
MQTLAFSQTYHLLAEIFRGDPADELRDYLRELPGFAEALTAEPEPNHYAIFGFNVFPYQSAFLSEDGQLGGAETERVQLLYAECGFPYNLTESPDHISVMLDCFVFLIGAEMDAEEDRQIRMLARLRGLQRRALDQHLLRWVPAFCAAVREQGSPFYAAAAELLLELVLAHYAQLSTVIDLKTPGFRLPPHPDPLSREKTGLKDIATYLCTPASSGWFLSRGDIGALGRQYRLPRGFGSRTQLLTNLFRAAVTYDHFPEVIDALVTLSNQWQRHYELLAVTIPAHVSPWQDALSSTQVMLSRVREAADALDDES